MKNILISILITLTFFPAFSQEMLTLEKCKELALKNNMRAKNAELTVLAAKEQKKEAFTKYFPSISLSGMGFISEKPMLSLEMDIASMIAPLSKGILEPLIGWAMMNGAPIDQEALKALQGMLESGPMKIDALKNGVVAGAVAMQPLFAGGQIVNGNKLAKAGVEARQLQKQMSDNEVLLTTERFFWQLVALQEKMKTLENSEKMLDHILSDVKVAVETGLTTRNDLTRVELERNRLAGFRLKAENGLQLLKLAFAQHIGVSAETLNIQPPPFDEFIPPITGNERLALQNRPEYKLLQKSVEIAKLQVNMEIGKKLPTVALGAAYQYMNFDLHTDNGMKNNFGMGFATVTVPITDWWGGAHAIKQKKLEFQMSENTRKENTELLLVQMQQVRNELNEAYYQIQLSQKSIDVAEENLRMSNDHYKAGITTLATLLEAQNLLQQTLDQYTESVTEYYKKMAEDHQMNVIHE